MRLGARGSWGREYKLGTSFQILCFEDVAKFARNIDGSNGNFKHGKRDHFSSTRKELLLKTPRDTMRRTEQLLLALGEFHRAGMHPTGSDSRRRELIVADEVST